ncbi:phage tail protein I [Thiocapsa sp.]|uniref:phage tail protein I n=1 Tax=Thiocapsa sp. TaxID=2024551 RepID=UPI0025F336F4|nr:phage tail protein I [Thiocapsa sp.]
MPSTTLTADGYLIITTDDWAVDVLDADEIVDPPVETLLPPSASTQERAIEATTSERIESIPAPIRTLWDPATCPASLLPWLAWTLSVDDWSSGWQDGVQRAVIAASIAQHARKGTVGAVRQALDDAGYGGCTITEGEPSAGARRDGSALRNGTLIRGGEANSWARYRVSLDRPITGAQAAVVRGILRNIAPARCELAALDYPTAGVLRNGSIRRDGTYYRGAA